jgi:hypothetical protein
VKPDHSRIDDIRPFIALQFRKGGRRNPEIKSRFGRRVVKSWES